LSLISLILIHFLAICSPGPDIFVTINNSLSHGRKSGVLTAFGVGLGNLFHITYCILFLDYLFNNLPNILDIIKYLGGAYIFYIGCKSIKSAFRKQKIEFTKEKGVQNGSSDFLSGMLTSTLNPKAMLFFISFYGFLVPTAYTLLQKCLLGLWMIGVIIIFLSSLASLSTTKYIQMMSSSKINLINFMFGIFLIFAGINILVTDFKGLK